jgi:hypothetical protein
MRGSSGSNTTSGVDWVRAVAVSAGSDEAWFSAVKRQHVALQRGSSAAPGSSALVG